MNVVALAIIVGLLGGLAVSFQNPLAGMLGDRIGAIESAFIIHLGGLVLASIVLLPMRGGNLGAWHTAPWYALTAGVLGVILIASLSYTIPRLGVTATVTLIVLAQLTIGAVLDHFGLLGVSVRTFDLRRAFGIVALFAGTWSMLR